LSDRWIDESEQLLKRLTNLSSKEKRDRLEIVNTMLFSLDLLERSLQGWRIWVRNLSIMSQFSLDELIDMEKTLQEQSRSFIEYDIEASKKWKDKFPQAPVIQERKTEEDEGRGEGRGIYV
jgi:hypothetical protein